MMTLFHYVLTDGERRYGAVTLVASCQELADRVIQAIDLGTWMPLPPRDQLLWSLEWTVPIDPPTASD